MEALFALMDSHGKYLSLDPATDLFHSVEGVEELQIWDYQNYSDEQTWFMGNSPRPKQEFWISLIPKEDRRKLGGSQKLLLYTRWVRQFSDTIQQFRRFWGNFRHDKDEDVR